MLLKDAPGDVKAAVVTISQVYMQGSSQGDEPGSRVILRDTPITTDLLTLANSTAELVKDGVVPAGTYGQLRFVITGGYIEIDNGNGTSSIYASSPNYAGLPQGATVTGALQMPSYATSGIKVNLPAHLDLIAEYDARRFNTGIWYSPMKHLTLKAELQNGEFFFGGSLRSKF